MKKTILPFFSVIIPCYNEAGHIQSFLKGLHSFFVNEKIDFELICINDGSLDQTKTELENFQKEYSTHCKIINFEINQGQGIAFREALKLAHGDYVFWLPSDGEIAPESLKPFLGQAAPHTVVISYPADGLKKRTLPRFFLSVLYQKILRFLFHLNFKYFNAMAIYPLETAKQTSFHSRRFFFPAELLIRTYKTQKLNYVEVPFELQKRKSGKSSAIKLRVLKEIARDLFLLYRDL